MLLIDEVDSLRTVFEDAAQQVQQFCRHRMGMELQLAGLQWVGLQRVRSHEFSKEQSTVMQSVLRGLLLNWEVVLKSTRVS